MTLTQILSKLKSLVYSKTETDTLLGNKAASSHTHTKSQITDFPTIPTDTNQLTNGAGYITSSGSCNYANSAEYVQGNNNSANAANALLRSGGGRSDSSPEGDTWIFLDELGGASAPWGFKHNQLVNTIGFYGAGTETSSINLSNGHFSGTVDWSHVVNRPTNVSNFTNDSGYITSSGSCNYANSAGSSSIATRDSGGTWISGRDNAVVKQTRHSTDDGGSWNPAVSVKTKNGNWTIGTVGYDKLQFSYDTDEDYNTGNNRNTVVELNPESGTIITSANIGSQSVNYANSSGNADTLDGYHHDSFPKTSEALFTVNGLGSPGWSAIGTGTGGSCIQVKTTDNTYPSICFHRSGYSHCVLAESGGQLGTMQQGSETFNPLITSANIGSQNVNYANSAGSVAWDNVSGRPWALSQFTNDSGFITSGLPIGSYIQFAGSQAPAGFLVCNGGAISRTTYSQLFAVIGTIYGSGDGWSTFNLPNLTDRFLQGSTTSGTVKNAGLPNITGDDLFLYGSKWQNKGSGALCADIHRGYDDNNPGSNFADYKVNFNAARSNSIYGNSSTVQPPALTCLICIKY